MIQTVIDRRRIMIVAIICVLVINIVMPVRRADAIAPAIVVPAAVGVFVGVVAVGAIAMDVFGMTEQSDTTMAFASYVWETSTTEMKNAVMSAYNTAVSTGQKAFTLPSAVSEYYANKIYQRLAVIDNTPINDPRIQYGYSDYGTYYKARLDVPAGSGLFFSTPFGLATTITAVVQYTDKVASPKIYYDYDQAGTFMGSYSTVSIYSSSQYFGRLFADKPADVQRAALITFFYNPTVWSSANYNAETAKKVKDAFPVSIPVPTPNDFIYTPTANPGADVKQVGDNLVDDAGKVYQPDQVKVKVAPKTQVVTDAAGNPAVDASGKPIVAVPVGSTQVGAPAIPGDLVNVRTGEKVTTGDTTANPPLDWASQPTTSINWAPLKMTGAALTRVFPFSIPWDVAAQLQIFNVKPEIPVIHVDIPRFWVAGDFVWHLKFDIDFTMFDPVAIGIRWIGNIAFTIGLALAMRRFMPQ